MILTTYSTILEGLRMHPLDITVQQIVEHPRLGYGAILNEYIRGPRGLTMQYHRRSIKFNTFVSVTLSEEVNLRICLSLRRYTPARFVWTIDTLGHAVDIFKIDRQRSNPLQLI